jgi:hypothetical protein
MRYFNPTVGNYFFSEKERCEMCRYYSKRDEECRREPPTVVVVDFINSDGSYPETHFPSVTKDQWCGRFELAEEYDDE